MAKKTKKTLRRKLRRSKRKGKVRTVKSIKRIVRQEISRNVENKCLQYQGGLQPGSGPLQMANWAANSVIDVTALTFDTIVQGVNQQQRVGNEIKIKSVMFRAVAYPVAVTGDPTSSTPPVELQMWVVSDKRAPKDATSAEINAIAASNWFQFGSASSAMAGYILDILKVPNHDELTIHKRKTYKVGPSRPNWTSVVNTNNDFKLNQKIRVNLTKYFNKKVKYNDNNPLTTNCSKPFICFQALPADGGLGQTDQSYCQIIYQIDVQWEDA